MDILTAQLAALADCIEGVDMSRVDHYRQLLRTGNRIEPIKVCGKNRQGFYVINDGNHRTFAHVLEGCDRVPAEIDPTASILDIRWRWPRISPMAYIVEMIGMPHVQIWDPIQ